jgi:hypothetical protein
MRSRIEPRQPPSAVSHALEQLDSSHEASVWAAASQPDCIASDWQLDSRLALKTPPGQTQLMYVLQLLSNPLSCDPQLPVRHE